MAQRGSPETVKRKELVGKLNPTCLKAFSEAAGMAKARGNPYVELAHFIDALSRTERTDFDIICRSAGVDGARLEGDIQRSLDKLPHGASAVEEFSDHIFHAIREANPNMSLVMVSHDLGVVQHIADRIVVLHDGRVEESGTTTEILKHPCSAYTRSLIEAASMQP